MKKKGVCGLLFLVFLIGKLDAQEDLMTLDTLTAQCTPTPQTTKAVPFTVRNFAQETTTELSLEKSFLLTLRKFSKISPENVFNIQFVDKLVSQNSQLQLASLTFDNDPQKRIRIIGFDNHKSDFRFFGIRKMYSGTVNPSAETFQELKYSIVPNGASQTNFKLITTLSDKNVAAHSCSLFNDPTEQATQKIDYFNSLTYRVGTNYFATANLYEPTWKIFAKKLYAKLATNPLYFGNSALIGCKQTGKETLAGNIKNPSEIYFSLGSFANTGYGEISFHSIRNSFIHFYKFDIPAVIQDKKGVDFVYMAYLADPAQNLSRDSYAITTLDAIKPGVGAKFKLLPDLPFNKNTAFDVSVYNGQYINSSKFKVNFNFAVNNCIY